MANKFLLIIAFATALVFNQMAFADPSICREGLNKMVQAIKLDDTQKQKIKPILDDLKSTLKSTGPQIGDIDTKINQQVNSATVDQDQVNSLVDQKTKLIGDMIKAKLKAQSQIFGILNADQKAKLQNIIKKADEKMAAIYKNCEQD